MSTDKKFGYFSQEAANAFGCSVYTTPDGGTVNVTNVDKRNDIELVKGYYLWDDVIAVGEVINQISSSVEELHIGDPYCEDVDSEDLDCDPYQVMDKSEEFSTPCGEASSILDCDPEEVMSKDSVFEVITNRHSDTDKEGIIYRGSSFYEASKKYKKEVSKQRKTNPLVRELTVKLVERTAEGKERITDSFLIAPCKKSEDA